MRNLQGFQKEGLFSILCVQWGWWKGVEGGGGELGTVGPAVVDYLASLRNVHPKTLGSYEI